jgi:hypothetical protein
MPPTLLQLLAEVAHMLDDTLGTRLDQAFPAPSPSPPENAPE